MKPSTASWLSLTIFVVYCADLAVKFPKLVGSFKALPWWSLVLALAIRFAYMAGLFWGFIFFRRKAKQTQMK